jgi:hypothetical protein
MGTTQMSARVEEAAMLTRNSLLPVATLATGQEKQFLFNATAGETISVAGLNLVMNPSDVDSVWITVDKPDGSLLREFRLDKRFDFPGARVSLINAPVTGTYRIFIDPEGTASFTMGLRVQDMVTGTLIPDTPYPLAMTTYGEAGWLQFDATAGQRFALNMSSIAMNPTGQSLSAYVYVYDPARNEVIHNQTVSSSVTTNFQASAAGTYHALIYGQEASIFTPQVLLASGLVGDIPTDGTVVPLAATAPGQIGYFTFQGVAGQNLSFAYTELASTPATGTIALTIRKPSGGALWSATGYRSDVPGNRKSLLNLPETGTYTITADPSDHVIASYKLRLSPFITGSLTSGAAAQAVNLPVRGDAAIYTFTAAANETLALNLGSILTSPTGKQVTLTVQDAAGNEVASSTGSSGITLNLRNLAAGEYRAYVTVANAATATAQIRLVQGITGHLTSGTTTPFNTTVPGQNAYFTFDGAVNVPTSLSFVTNTLAPATGTLGFTVKRPDGTSWYTDDAYRTHLPGDQFNQLNLTQTGVYSLIVDPSDYTVMSSNVRVAPMVSGTLVPGDPNQALSFPAQGDAAIYTFTISTARNVSINLTSITTVPSGETTRIGVYNASGTSVGSNTGTSASRTLTINNLAAGTYRVIISLPEAGTATMQVRIP